MTIDWQAISTTVLVTAAREATAVAWRGIKGIVAVIRRALARGRGLRASVTPALKTARLAEVDETRLFLLEAARTTAALGEGNTRAAEASVKRIDENPFPHFRPQLIADERLVRELCTTVPEAFEATGRLSDDLRMRLHTLPNVIREAFRLQEERVHAVGEPLLRTGDQHARLSEAAGRVNQAMKRYRGPLGIFRGVATMVRRW